MKRQQRMRWLIFLRARWRLCPRVQTADRWRLCLLAGATPSSHDGAPLSPCLWGSSSVSGSSSAASLPPGNAGGFVPSTAGKDSLAVMSALTLPEEDATCDWQQVLGPPHHAAPLAAPPPPITAVPRARAGERLPDEAADSIGYAFVNSPFQLSPTRSGERSATLRAERGEVVVGAHRNPFQESPVLL
eukprot:scaffold30453_cov32-Tisochrysis_lutea.AAC.2